MTVLQWDEMTFLARTNMIRDIFPNLSDEQFEEVTNEWSHQTYEDSAHGENTAIADLIAMCRNKTITPEQLEELERNVRSGIE